MSKSQPVFLGRTILQFTFLTTYFHTLARQETMTLYLQHNKICTKYANVQYHIQPPTTHH